MLINCIKFGHAICVVVWGRSKVFRIKVGAQAKRLRHFSVPQSANTNQTRYAQIVQSSHPKHTTIDSWSNWGKRETNNNRFQVVDVEIKKKLRHFRAAHPLLFYTLWEGLYFMNNRQLNANWIDTFISVMMMIITGMFCPDLWKEFN